MGETARARVLSSLSPLVATISGIDVPAELLSGAQSIRLLNALSAVPYPVGAAVLVTACNGRC
jgi:hypothetical protein